jgi:hypothetical protein
MLYNSVIRLAAENRISESNTWELDFIDRLPDIIQHEDASGFNFQKASCGLDASVKIYSTRVDATYKLAQNTLSGLGSARPGADGGVQDDDDPENPRRAGRSAGDANSTPESTLETKKEALAAKNLSDTSEVDPLFHKTSALFDQGGAQGKCPPRAAVVVLAVPSLLHRLLLAFLAHISSTARRAHIPGFGPRKAEPLHGTPPPRRAAGEQPERLHGQRRHVRLQRLPRGAAHSGSSCHTGQPGNPLLAPPVAVATGGSSSCTCTRCAYARISNHQPSNMVCWAQRVGRHHHFSTRPRSACVRMELHSGLPITAPDRCCRGAAPPAVAPL